MLKSTFLSGILVAFLGFSLAAVALWVLPICHGHDVMSCFWMVRCAALMGLLVGLSGCFMLLLKPAGAVGVQLMNILLGAAIVALATVVIGPCPSPMMACHSVTGKVLTLWGIIVMVVAAADAWRLSRT